MNVSLVLALEALVTIAPHLPEHFAQGLSVVLIIAAFVFFFWERHLDIKHQAEMRELDEQMRRSIGRLKDQLDKEKNESR